MSAIVALAIGHGIARAAAVRGDADDALRIQVSGVTAGDRDGR